MADAPRRLDRIELRPTREQSALLIRLTFQSSRPRPPTIAFELDGDDASYLLSALQTAQRRMGWRMPQFFGRRQKPTLSIVKDDGE